MKNYAIVENQKVINTAVAEPEYAISQNWIEYTGPVSIGWSYINGEFKPPVIEVTPEEAKAENKKIAEAVLAATDWTQVADVPLVNKSDFTAYRAAVRAIALNPTEDAVFPDMPTEQWS